VQWFAKCKELDIYVYICKPQWTSKKWKRTSPLAKLDLLLNFDLVHKFRYKVLLLIFRSTICLRKMPYTCIGDCVGNFFVTSCTSELSDCINLLVYVGIQPNQIITNRFVHSPLFLFCSRPRECLDYRKLPYHGDVARRWYVSWV